VASGPKPAEVIRPAEVAKPTEPTRVKAESLPNRLGGLPRAPGALHDGRAVDGLDCQGPASRPEVQDVARQADEAALQSHKEAIALLERAVAAEPTAGQLYLHLADEADALADLEPVAPLARALETYSVNCPSTATVTAVLQRAVGALAPAPTGAAPTPSRGHRDPLPPAASADELLKRAEEDYRLGDLSSAQQHLDRARAKHANVSRLQKQINEAKAKADAIQARRDEVEFAGKSVEDLKKLANQAEDARDFDRALRILRRGLALAPKDPGLHKSAGSCHMALGHVDEAVAEYQRFVTLAPNDPKAASIRATLKLYRAVRKHQQD
jgi:tetratricopeptide (TPR) repeat protein